MRVVMRQSLLLLTFAAIGVVGCEQATAPTAPVQPRATLVVPAGITLVENGNPLSADVSYTATIDASGGTLGIGPHKLVVPAGAVGGPTLFTGTVKAGSFIEVDLHATRLSDGATLSTFGAPLTLLMNYRAAKYTDPTRLLIVAVTTDSTSDLLPQPSLVDVNNYQVIAQIYHFSDYVLGSN